MSVALLIPEPPLQLLRSLAKQIGLSEAIVLQQVHYRELLADDGWVSRTYGEWSKADFPFWTPRTVERIFVKLRERGLLIAQETGSSPTDRTLRYRVDLGRVPTRQNVGVEADNLSRQNVGVCKREIVKKGANAPNAREEPPGFADWLEHHCEVTGKRVMATEGTKARAAVASMFGERRREYPDADLRLVSLGAMADDKRRERGYTDPESVLRPMAVPKLLARGAEAGEGDERGRAVEAALAAAPQLSQEEIDRELARVGL